MAFAKGLSLVDMALLIAPFAVLMILAMFGMDEQIATRPARGAGRRRFCEVDRNGRGSLSDPHGKSADGAVFPPAKVDERRNFSQKRGFCPSDELCAQREEPTYLYQNE